jgi:hypothetical protein
MPKPDKLKQEKPTASQKEKSSILTVHIKPAEKPVLSTSESEESENFPTSR